MALSDEHRQVREMVRRFADDAIRPVAGALARRSASRPRSMP
jgi:alkylation response protein AidB-like acyl-CoA dehydrogenase